MDKIYTKYEKAKKMIESYAFKKKKMPLSAKILYIALAKQTDIQQSDEVSLSEDEMVELLKEEMAIYSVNKAIELFAQLNIPISEDEGRKFVYFLIVSKDIDLEKACHEIISLIKYQKKLSEKHKIELRKALIGNIH